MDSFDLPATNSDVQYPRPAAPLLADISGNSPCLPVVDPDLNGNGKPDRLLLWSIGNFFGITPGLYGQNKDVHGAVAHLDDGSEHRLQTDPKMWSSSLTGSSEQEVYTLYPLDVTDINRDWCREVLVAAWPDQQAASAVIHPPPAACGPIKIVPQTYGPTSTDDRRPSPQRTDRALIPRSCNFHSMMVAAGRLSVPSGRAYLLTNVTGRRDSLWRIGD